MYQNLVEKVKVQHCLNVNLAKVNGFSISFEI